MKISKQGSTFPEGTPTPEMLARINGQSKGSLKAEDIYVFSVRLCDDQIDRDGERFAREALPELGRLFLGKPGIVDHNWSAEKQVARIFDTCVEQENGVSWLRAWAYIPREGREELIRDIETGIRREVSISCSMGKRSCSICGGEPGACGHRRGELVQGQTCAVVLSEPRDAYEFSFVAVPAQPMAGVVKHWKGGEEMELYALVEKSGSGQAMRELENLKAMAAFGEERRESLRKEAVRMGVALKLGPDRSELEKMAAALEPQVLEKLCRGMRQKLEEELLPQTQLGVDPEAEMAGEAYLV
ncbi:MAG: hypothetical protein PUC06_05520 [Oscillospiraceae bacterium]|nr:hypothetical protein [Oscillospiraceae bacterium]